MVEKRPIRRIKGSAKRRGYSLLELAIAMSVLMVGLLGSVVVIGVASANNGKSKMQTASATLAASTMEKILTIPSSANGTAAETQMKDCAGNTFLVETAQGGSPLIPAGGAFAGSIDFSQPAQPNYSMVYTMCSTSNGGGIYDVRWNVSAGPTPSTQMITVAAKSIGNKKGVLFTLPFNLRQMRGDH